MLTANGEAVLTVVRFAVTGAQVASGLINLDEEGDAEAEGMRPS